MVLNSAVLAYKTAAVLAYSSAAIDVMDTGHRSFQCSVTKSGSTVQACRIMLQHRGVHPHRFEVSGTGPEWLQMAASLPARLS